MIKKHRKHSFTLIELSVCLALLLTLTSIFSFFGYDTLKEFRKRHGKAAFYESLLTLTHENSLKENHLMLLISQEGDYIKTTLGGNTTGLNIKKIPSSFYTGLIFEENGIYAIKITPTTLPSEKNLKQWVIENDCLYSFYVD
jgi:hypothetical protein